MVKNLILTDNITLPIDEGLKKFSYNFMKYALAHNEADVCSSPENIGLDGIRLYTANKLMCSTEIKRLLNNKIYKYVYYIPEASSTFNSFIRLWMLKLQAPKGTKLIMISIQKRKHKMWQKLLIRMMGKFHVISFSHSVTHYLQNIGVRAEYQTVGVDGNIYYPVSEEQKLYLREKYKVGKKAKVVLHVGHIRRRRNILMLKALQYSGYQVVVVGSTSMAYEEDVANELSNAGVKIFKEYNPHIEEMYQLADVYAFPVLRTDGAIEFPLSILEAMACGLPIITTPFGALKDNFETTTGFRYGETEEDFIKQIDALYGTKSPQNRDLVLTRYSWDNVFENILNRV